MHPVAPCPGRPARIGPGTGPIHGPGSPLVAVLGACRRVAASDATVLITGETGTGKEVIARFVHEHSRRAGRPLVPVNCGAIPEALLESELFGHVRGAFTGAVGARRGRLALAEGGTLFLDEIGELPLSLQVKLLRVIQERCYEPVGSAESVSANFRLIAATNRNLAVEVEAGRFRRDLYFRLMVVPLELPPLRERPQDVVALFLHFWELRGETRPIAPELLGRLQRHDWPGNVRELENLVERLSVCAEGETIGVADLPLQLRSAGTPRRTAAALVAELDEGAAPANGDRPTPATDACSADRPIPFPPPVAIAGDPVASAAPPAAPSVPTAPPETFAASATNTPLAPAPTPRTAPDVPEVPEVLTPRLPVDLPVFLRQIEDAYIDLALSRSNGNKKAAAEFLGLQRTTLVEKLRRRCRETSRP